MPDKEGVIINSANLTMDKETGLGNWTEEQFIEAVRFAKRPDGKALRYPMQPFPKMTAEEAATIWAYLQTVPVIRNEVARNFE